MKSELELSLQNIQFISSQDYLEENGSYEWETLNYLRFSQKSSSGFSLKVCFIGGVLLKNQLHKVSYFSFFLGSVYK